MLDIDHSPFLYIFEDERWSPYEERVLADVDTLLGLLKARYPFLGSRPIQISLCFSNDETIQPLNKAYRQKDKPTNVLSFPQVEIDRGDLLDDPLHETDLPIPDGFPFVLGDIILAFETVEREADEGGMTIEDHAVHLVLHGLLHLLGFDHESEEEASEMESTEIEVLEEIGIANPYDDKRELHEDTKTS